MKILIISGFLGAGKTTFIQALAKHTKKEFVILENEYGEVDVDSTVLKNENMNIWELTEGCICCSVKADFGLSILTIANTLDPDYLIVEPSGVGMLSNIFKNMKKVEYERIELLAPITLVDYHSFHEYLTTFDAYFKDQIINAGHILLSKGEEAESSDLDNIGKSLRELNPKAEILTDHYEGQPDEWWNSLLTTAWNEEKGIYSIDTESMDMSSLSFKGISYDHFEDFQSDMGALMRGSFGQIYRVKGFLPINGQWGKLDIVNKIFSLETWEPLEESKIVIIGRNLDQKALSVLFQQKKA